MLGVPLRSPKLIDRIANLIRHNFYHYAEFDGVLKRDGSNLPLSLSSRAVRTREDSSRRDGRPVGNRFLFR